MVVINYGGILRRKVRYEFQMPWGENERIGKEKNGNECNENERICNVRKVFKKNGNTSIEIENEGIENKRFENESFEIDSFEIEGLDNKIFEEKRRYIERSEKDRGEKEWNDLQTKVFKNHIKEILLRVLLENQEITQWQYEESLKRLKKGG
jgi:hypothetical protein